MNPPVTVCASCRIEDALDIVRMVHAGSTCPVILVATSFSGWIALQVAKQLPHIVKVCYPAVHTLQSLLVPISDMDHPAALL